MNKRREHDSMGEIYVDADKWWGAQTQRSLEHFKIGAHRMPYEIIYAISRIKRAAAKANCACGLIGQEKEQAIVEAVDRILRGEADEHFVLKVYQTGSGTQSNMNVNEVISHMAADRGVILHPNDDVNRAQSSNDVFPSALHMAVGKAIEDDLLPALEQAEAHFKKLEKRFDGIIKVGRTHYQDATPIRLSDEVSAWTATVSYHTENIRRAAEQLFALPLGGTAVGTGLNTPKHYRREVFIALQEDGPYRPMENTFHGLSTKSELCHVHGTLRALACDMMKIANDVRALGSGPRCGLGELRLPANEPGSSIMPGKVNPTQCEQMTMVSARVMGNDQTVAVAASQGQFELNVFMPLLGDTILESVHLMADSWRAFSEFLLDGLSADTERIAEYVDRSLMNVTALTPEIGYENAARIAHYAHEKGLSLRESAAALKLLKPEDFDRLMNISAMAVPHQPEE